MTKKKLTGCWETIAPLSAAMGACWVGSMGAGILDWMKMEEVYRGFKVTFRLELLVKCRTGLRGDGFQSRVSSLSTRH